MKRSNWCQEHWLLCSSVLLMEGALKGTQSEIYTQNQPKRRWSIIFPFSKICLGQWCHEFTGNNQSMTNLTWIPKALWLNVIYLYTQVCVDMSILGVFVDTPVLWIMRRRFLYNLKHRPFIGAVYQSSFKFQTIQAYDLMCSLLFTSLPLFPFICSLLCLPLNLLHLHSPLYISFNIQKFHPPILVPGIGC